MRLLVLVALMPSTLLAYPTDPVEQERTGIRRLKWQYDVDRGTRRGRRVPPGAQWPSEKIALAMSGATDYALSSLTEKDPELQAQLEAILRRGRYRNYRVALLDITYPEAPRYAGVNELRAQTPGSVAKVLVATGLLSELAKRFPNDVSGRERMLREHVVTADDWALPNHHEVPVVKGDRVSIRKVYPGDSFSLWEWLDHALSPSSNASATMVWREATLMRLMGDAYPPKQYDKALFERWDRETWTRAAFDTLVEPIVKAGLDPELFYLKMFFTKNANRFIYSASSRATPLGVVDWMLKVEQGKLVDSWSSLELKRLLYLTRRRVRYLKTKTLDSYAAFFKSGSFYQCKPEPGYTCIAYQGNVSNILNSLVEIQTVPPSADSTPEAFTPETAVEESGVEQYPPNVYIVAVMSNELKRNAAYDHARLADAIHKAVTGLR